jgi:hypothetical protein
VNSIRLALAAAAFQALALRPAHEPRKITVYPSKPKDTDADRERMAKAQAKRERKAAKRVRS